MSAESDEKARQFLAVAGRFRLGALPTEQRHPLTGDLAQMARADLPKAFAVLKEIDADVIGQVAAYETSITRLRTAIAQTMDDDNRVFFYGCGATGRLSISIDYLWRSLYPDRADRVLGFMSGGDLALVHSIENFEDHAAYGARQVREIGFGPRDLLVCCTEGGETSSVIGAAEAAATISARKPFFLYCNPDDALRQIERSRAVLDNPAIEKINLFVGPMALSGSTRMQAGTALMLAAGAALLGVSAADMRALQDFIARTDFSFLAPFTEAEAQIYQDGDFVLYETDRYGVTILTDTTERAPTFSLRGFENQNDPDRVPSLSYFCIPDAKTAAAAWEAILLRLPITIEWDELKAVSGMERLMGFDFSAAARMQRRDLVAPQGLHRFSVTREGNDMRFSLGSHSHNIDISGLPPLCEHLFLKIALNMHSTLLMGRLGRYESNVMTWVKPSNYKLIDRAIRYVEYLLHHKSIMPPSYEEICFCLFEQMETLAPADSIVLKTCAHIAGRA